ncbi:MAG: hypothetical protein OXH79_08305 [Boseongicola sp.]|nr:hypothetical protein [Boseongicola sp.]
MTGINKRVIEKNLNVLTLGKPNEEKERLREFAQTLISLLGGYDEEMKREIIKKLLPLLEEAEKNFEKGQKQFKKGQEKMKRYRSNLMEELMKIENRSGDDD